MAGQFRHGCDVEVHDPLGAETRRGDIDAVFVERRALLAHLLHQREQRATKWHEAIEPDPRQHRRAGAEEILRIRVREHDLVVRIDHDDGMADGVEHDGCGVSPVGQFRHHAALRIGCVSSKAMRSASDTAFGSVDVMIAARSALDVSDAWRSRYQPRCLRA